MKVRFALNVVLSFVAASTTAPGQTTFIDVQEAVGINFTHEADGVCPNPPIGSGSAWADYDNDGDIDLYVTSMGGESRLYQNQGDTNGDGLPDFIDVASSLGVVLENWTAGVVFVDYDNDGDQDLYVTRWGGNYLFQNQLTETGSATFEDVTAFAGVGDSDRANTAAWADYNQDGWLDLYLAKHFDCLPNNRESRDILFKNNGDGTFTNVSYFLCADGSLTCDQLNLGHAITAAWFDYDNDGDPDLYVANDVVAAGYPNILWRNDGSDGTGGWLFTDVSEESGTDYSINCLGLGIGDYDNDGWLDIATGSSEEGYLLRNLGDGTFEDVSVASGIRREWVPGISAITWATPFIDYDNDQYLDLCHVRGMIGSTPINQPDVLFHNNRDGTFTDVSDEGGVDDPRRGRSASMCDFDQDGFVDLFVGNYATEVDLYYNQSSDLGNTNHWIAVTAEGIGSVNRDAIGARFSLTTPDGITQIREITSGPTYGGGDYKAAYFGMGENLAGTLTVRWPDGETHNLGAVSADQHLHIANLIQSVSDDNPVVSRFELLQNYPNPFNPKSEIGIRIAETGQVTLKVYDLLGREVAILLEAQKAPGSYSVTWDAAGFPSGVYYYRMHVQPAEGGHAGDYIETKKLVLLR